MEVLLTKFTVATHGVYLSSPCPSPWELGLDILRDDEEGVAEASETQDDAHAHEEASHQYPERHCRYTKLKQSSWSHRLACSL